MVEEVKKLKMKIVDFNKKQMKERIEKIKVETEKRISEGTVQNRPVMVQDSDGSFYELLIGFEPDKVVSKIQKFYYWMLVQTIKF